MFINLTHHPLSLNFLHYMLFRHYMESTKTETDTQEEAIETLFTMRVWNWNQILKPWLYVYKWKFLLQVYSNP